MRIAVCLKQTFDTEARINISPDGKILKEGVNLIINPYDEFAVEEALRIKEREGGGVTVITVGGQEAQEALRQALAMGADDARLIDPGTGELDEYATAVILAAALSGRGYDMVLGGMRTVDNAAAQVMSRVAEVMGLPVVNAVTRLELEDGMAVATHDIEGGSEIVEVSLPAVFTAQKGLNEPRYPSMKGIMQAKKKPMDRAGAGDLGLGAGDAAPKVRVLGCFLPKGRTAGKVMAGDPPEAAVSLVKALKEDKVL